MRISFYTPTKFIAGLLAPLLLCGFFLDKKTGPSVPSEGLQLSEKQADWSQFIGYGPEAYATRLSTFNQNGTLIIVQQARKIFGIETNTGRTRWCKNSDHYTFTNPATANHTKIFIGTNEPRLLALDSNTGNILWSTRLPATTLARVATDQNQVFVKTTTDLIALDESNGKILWQYKHPSPSVTLKTSSAPQLTKDKVVVGFPDGKLLTFDRTTGQLIWKHTVAQTKPGAEFDKLVDIAADPIIDNESSTIYVSAYQGKLQSLSLASGDIKWERPFSGHMPLVLAEHLYGLDSQEVLYAFDKSNGNIIWSQSAFKDYKKVKPDYQVTGPILTSDKTHLIVADYIGNLYWFSLNDGQIIGKVAFNIASPILNLPLTQESKVYAINRRSQMAAWDFMKHQSFRSFTDRTRVFV